MTTYYGNKRLLNERKIAFFCPNRIWAEFILKSLDWARDRKNAQDCIISGFSTIIEKSVFEILSRGSQPIILKLTPNAGGKYSATRTI